MGWNPALAQSWATELGLVSVPMFDAARSSQHQGTHVILLDGATASAAMSIGAMDALEALPNTLSWAWSANVRHSLFLDPSENIVRWRRCDSPGDIQEYSVAQPRSAGRLLSRFEAAPSLQTKKVIDRAIEIFRIVRAAIEERNGNQIDSVRAFNALLVWADKIRNGALARRASVSLGEVLSEINQSDDFGALTDEMPQRVASIDLGRILDELLDYDPDTHYLLDPDLLLRHASGALYQEAHYELLYSSQQRLFATAVSPDAANRSIRKDIHFTPPSLARLLAEESLWSLGHEPPTSIVDVLDPAVGSGVFLLEMAREAVDGTVHLRGIDNSDISCEMARAAISRSGAAAGSVINGDSLALEWGEPDIVLTNPPFMSWSDMDADQRTIVKNILGDNYTGRADLALAFLQKAVASIKPGGVVASLLPASFLESDSASSLRREIADQSRFAVLLVGHFKGYEYFHGAIVEPAFVVLRKRVPGDTDPNPPTTFLTAEKGFADEAIRGLRRMRAGVNVRASGQWSIVTQLELGDRWIALPKPPTVHRVIERSRRHAGILTVSQLFKVSLGARVGGKEAFMLSADEFRALGNAEKQLFLPVADDIVRGAVRESEYIFFPYDRHGQLVIHTESDLKHAVPQHYELKLKEARAELKSRRSHHGHWWELDRPRPWQRAGTPKIVSKEFGALGNFTFDDAGRFAVVQGVAWFWRRGNRISQNLGFAYSALLNSRFFFQLVEASSQKLKGGQFKLARRFMDPIPLPDLSAMRSLSVDLAEIGRKMHVGRDIDESRLELIVAKAYQGSTSESTEAEFMRLADQWVEDTGHLSNVATKARHPAYQAIIQMGEEAIPFLLRELERSPNDWFAALYRITGADPIQKSSYGIVEEMADAWIAWGMEQGYGWQVA